jgi:hypothetical protein
LGVGGLGTEGALELEAVLEHVQVHVEALGADRLDLGHQAGQLVATDRLHGGGGASIGSPSGATVTMFEHGFTIDGQLMPGPQLLKVANVGAQPHFMILIQPNEPVTKEQVSMLLEAAEAQRRLADLDVAQEVGLGRRGRGAGGRAAPLGPPGDEVAAARPAGGDGRRWARRIRDRTTREVRERINDSLLLPIERFDATTLETISSSENPPSL